MKTTTRFFAFFASVALALGFSAGASFAEGNYTLAWGGNYDSQLDIPGAVISNATQIAAGPYHTLAVVNRRVYAWGDPKNDAVASLPPDIQNISSVFTGYNSGLAINEYGNVRFWTGTNAWNNFNFRDPNQFPGNLYGHTYRSAALGRDHGLLLTTGGAVEAWGTPEDMEPVSIPNAQWKKGFTAVAVGLNFSLGLSNGVVHVAVPERDPNHIKSDLPAVATQFVSGTRSGPIEAIAAGPYHAMALTTDGDVFVWGAWYQDPPQTSQARPLPRGSWGNVTNIPDRARSGVKAIAAGDRMCAVLTTNGEVIVWGNEASDGSRAMAQVPPYALQDIQEISLGYQHVVVRSVWLPPEFTDTSLPDAHLESEYTAAVPLRADPAAKVKVLNERSLPPGISLATNGVFHGTPTALGTNIFSVVASNAYGSVTQSFTIVVRERNVTVPVWNTTDLPPAVVGFPFGYQSGAPYNGFQLDATENPTFTAASLPSWLTLSSAGRLTGTPSSADVGSSYPTFTAVNSAGSSNRLFQLVVGEPTGDTPPVIGLKELPNLLVGAPESIDLQIAGATRVFLSGDLAGPFSVVSSNGTWFLVGTPTAAIQGDGRTATVVASNSTSSATATAEYLVAVKGPPQWETTGISPAVVGVGYTNTLSAKWATSYQISASSLNPIPLRFSVKTNDDSSVVAVLTGTPTNTLQKTFSIPVTAANAFGNTSRTFTLTLRDTPSPGEDPGYRFVSIVPSSSNLVLSWIVTNGADSSAVLVSTTNLLSWPTNGTLYNASPATITPRPSVPTHYRLQVP